jgi:hypothetical protein
VVFNVVPAWSVVAISKDHILVERGFTAANVASIAAGTLANVPAGGLQTAAPVRGRQAVLARQATDATLSRSLSRPGASRSGGGADGKPGNCTSMARLPPANDSSILRQLSQNLNVSGPEGSGDGANAPACM